MDTDVRVVDPKTKERSRQALAAAAEKEGWRLRRNNKARPRWLLIRSGVPATECPTLAHVAAAIEMFRRGIVLRKFKLTPIASGMGRAFRFDVTSEDFVRSVKNSPILNPVACALTRVWGKPCWLGSSGDGVWRNDRGPGHMARMGANALALMAAWRAGEPVAFPVAIDVEMMETSKHEA